MRGDDQRTPALGRSQTLAGHLDLNRLAVFTTLVDAGTMSRSSDRLFLTQPAVSAHIKALEAALGVTLFNRVGRRLVVSAAGRVLYDKAQQLFSVADGLISEMEDVRGVRNGRLRLGSSIVWEYHLPSALEEFKREYPDVEICLLVANSDRIERMVQDRSVDMGFIGRPAQRPGLVSEPLATDEVVPICGRAHPLTRAAGPSPGDLSGERFVVREVGSATRLATDRALGSLGSTASISMELGGQEAIKQAVQSGRGVGMVCMRGVEPEVGSGLLAIANVPWLRHPLELNLIYHREKKLALTHQALLATILRSDGASSSSASRSA